MKSYEKTDECQLYCKGCDEFCDEYGTEYRNDICKECEEIYNNKTGWCGLSCCLGNGCDQSC